MVERLRRERHFTPVSVDDRVTRVRYLADHADRGSGLTRDVSEPSQRAGREGEEELVVRAAAQGPLERIAAEGRRGGSGCRGDGKVRGADASAGTAAPAE